jgi:hypothetical protein
MNANNLDKDGLPTEQGIYLIEEPDGSNTTREIDVYEHPVKGLCCFAEDFGSEGSGVDDEYDCHVSVQCTGLTFIKKLRNLEGVIKNEPVV